MLKEQIERSILMGIGLFSITREKAQGYVDELVKQGSAARDEAKELTDKLVKRGEEERGALRILVREEMNTALKEMHLSTTEDIKNLQAQIEALKVEVAAASSKKA